MTALNNVMIMRAPANDGCTWYRLTQFQKESVRQKLANVQFINVAYNDKYLTEAIKNTAAFVIRLDDMVAFDLYDVIRNFSHTIPIILDIDDNYEVPDPLSDMYRVYGTSEVQLGDGSYLWQDGVAEFNIEHNVKRLERFRDIMRHVSGIITTTFTLKQYAEQYNPNAVVIPNAIHPDYFPNLELKRDGKVKILWAGGSTHYPDLIEIKGALLNVMNRNPQVEFHMLGVAFQGIVRDLPKDRVKTYGWINADGHGYRLATIGADIGIAPLKDMEFNYHKSSVKYYEYSALGMATLARRITPYTDDIVHDQTGYLYDTPEEFERYLDLLVNDSLNRINVGKNARDYVYKYRDVREVTKDWAEYINEMVAAYRSNRKKVYKQKNTGLKILMAPLSFKKLTGSELYHYELAREMVAMGHDVTITGEVGGEIADKARDVGVRLLPVSESVNLKCDVIHTSQTDPTMWACKTFNQPVIQTVHSEHPKLWDYEKPYLDSRVKHYVAIRDTIKEKLPHESSVIYNPIDFSRFHPFGGDKPSRKTVVFPGTIDGLRKASALKLVEMSVAEGFDVIFVGHKYVDYGELPANVTVMDARWNVETILQKATHTASILMGRTTIEGWACGLPGYIFQIDDEGGYISHEIVDPPVDMERFDSKKVAQQMIALYEEVIREN